MKSRKGIKFNKSSIRILIEILLITVSVFVLTNTSGAKYVFNSLIADAEEDINTKTYTINNAADLVAFSASYAAAPDFYKDWNIRFAIAGGSLSELSGFLSIGTEQYPFEGSFIADSLSVTLDKPLFNYVSDSFTIKNYNDIEVPITIIRSASNYSALFAENVVHNTTSTEESAVTKWTINTGAYTDDAGPKLNSFAGVIGTIKENARVNITLNNYAAADGKGSDINGTGNVGLICQTMMSGSSLTVSVSGVTDYNVMAQNGYAGGLVGYATDAEVIFGDSASVYGTISGSNGSGGVFGYYENTQNREFDIGGFNVLCTLNGNNSGGVFGELKNGANGIITIKNTGSGQISTNRTSSDSNTYGGLIGVYSSDSTASSLIISDITVNSNKSAGTAGYYGGIIGAVDDDSYVKMENAAAIASGGNANVTDFGGLVGYVDKAFIEAKNVTISAVGNFAGGGVIGNMNGGVLRLDGTSDLSGAMAESGGQIVGKRGNQALIYAADGWELIRSAATAVDDIGTWGEVLRFNGSFTEGSVLTVDNTLHTVTVNEASTAVGDLSAFAKLALNIQMNNGTNDTSTLRFGSTSSSALLSSGITLTDNIDLTGTGITGLTRDDGANAVYSCTFNGGNKTITLAIGEIYGNRKINEVTTPISSDDTNFGNGTIYRHRYNGLFAKTGAGAKFTDLTVNGSIALDYGDNSVSYFIGGLSAFHQGGDFTAENVSVNEKINYRSYGSSNNANNYAGGMIGTVTDISAATVITITGGTIGATIDNQSSNSRLLCGGAIGEIGNISNLTINASGVTLNANVTNNSTRSEKKVGGFIGSIKNNNNNNIDTREITLTDFTVSGTTVNSNTTDGQRIGGALLGESWYNIRVIIGGETENGITISDSSVNMSGSGDFAGLVTIATGYWKAYDIKINSIAVNGQNARSFGMLVNRGNYNYNALYLEMAKENAYQITGVGANLTSLKADAVFDELVATCSGEYRTVKEGTSSVLGNGNCAVVSIHTSGGTVTMDGAGCNTYQNQTGRVISNYNTRYYYNLDVIRQNAASAPEKLMLWSVNTYACNNIKKYFTNPFTNNKITTGEYNMTGYSYYPVDTSGVTIEDGCKFIFCNKEIEAGELTAPVNTDGYARTTSAANSQHYLMHFGLFQNISGALTVNNSTFSGNTGKYAHDYNAEVINYCGALVCGKIIGDNALPPIKIALSGITLDGIVINGGDTADYAPLLINAIGSSTNFTLSNIKTTAAYKSGDITLAAATSLIGNVGGDSADKITLTFSNIVLDGRKAADSLTELNTAYNTTKSIFTNATLLNKFTYPSGKNCTAVYNYKHNEDWGGTVKHQVTYGAEISNSEEYQEVGQQKWYVDSDQYTSPESDTANAPYDFTKNFLRYAAAAYSYGGIDHEIKVNHKGAANLNVGCGTYNDPYIITSAGQLMLVADLLGGKDPAEGVKINYIGDNYKSWCEDKNSHKELTWNTSNFVSEDNNTTVEIAAMQQALSTAYYKINGDNGDIILPPAFIGIGKTLPFKGVIIGADTAGKTTITNNSTSPLIYQSKGSVVKNLTVNVTADFSKVLRTDSNSKYATDEGGSTEFYGGIIGIVHGGDNIIDNVSVTFSQSSTINIDSGSYRGNIAVGGYIGVVRYGGVFFRNMNNAVHSGISPNDNPKFGNDIFKVNNKNNLWLYCNPIIGRVIDGFAVTETTSFNENVTMNNGTKNYSITDINKGDAVLSFGQFEHPAGKNTINAGVVNIANAQQMFILGCISMSGAGSAPLNGGYSGYSYGSEQMVRHAQYDDVGKNDKNDLSDFNLAAGDDFTTNGVPYIIYHYTQSSAAFIGGTTVSYPARSVTNEKCVFNIELAGGTYDMPDGFRGIGSLSSDNANLQMYIYGINGNGSIIDLNMRVNAYSKNYEFYYEKSKKNEYKVGLGLFNSLVQNKSEWLPTGTDIEQDTTGKYTISNLTLSGNVIYNVYKSEIDTAIQYGESYYSCAGGLAGTSNSSNTQIKDVKLSNLNVCASYVSGGLIGSVWGSSYNKVKINNFSAEELNIGGGFISGGLIAFAKNCKLEADGNNNTFKFKEISSGGSTGGFGDNNGAGGLLGTIYNSNSSRQYETSLSIQNIDIEGNSIFSKSSQSFVGSVIGSCGDADNNHKVIYANITNVNARNIDINIGGTNKTFCGGLIGTIKKSVVQTELVNCHVIGSTTEEKVIYGNIQAGGLVGLLGANLNVDKCSVENYTLMADGTSNNPEGVSGFLGKLEFGKVANLKNSKVSNCVLKTIISKPAGGVVGSVVDNSKVYGYNIALQNIKVTDMNGNDLTSSWNVAGDIAGQINSGSEINLVGVCMKSEKYIGKNIGSKSGSSYVIFSDYNGACLNEASANKIASTVNNENNMGAYPYATVNPITHIDSTQYLTGDGAYKNIIQKIMDEVNTDNGYRNISTDDVSGMISFSSKLSTFNSKTGANITEDFPVLVVNESNYVNITNMINSYIHHLTNDSSINYAAANDDRFNIVISPYRLNESKIFEIPQDHDNTIEISNGYFRMTDKDYDSSYEQFTLIDIQYYDPTTSADRKIVYHLYIPVYVEKMLKFDFKAAALSGTDYNTAKYTYGLPVLESYGTPVTSYVNYSYLRTASEWENAINSGENVLKGYGKSVVVDCANALPASTRLVLVDKNKSDKAYYSTIGSSFTSLDSKLDFSLFSSSDGTAFSPVPFIELLSKSADITAQQDTNGTLVKCDENDADKTVKIGGEYYKKKPDGDTSATYRVTVTAKNGMVDVSTGILKVDEEYYISFFTETDATAPMRNIVICCNRRLGDENMTPSHMNNVSAEHENMVHIILGNLYDQTFSFKTTSASSKINEENKTIPAELETVISLKAENAEMIRAFFDYESIHLYHSFIIEATREDENGTEKGIKGDPQVYGTYTINGTPYSINHYNSESAIKLAAYDDSGSIIDIKEKLKQGNVTISCTSMTIGYSDDTSIIAQFPERKNDDDTYGVTYSANSNLAYVADKIEYSNISVNKTDEKGNSFYRENITYASLSYNIPAVTANELTVLGINGRETNDTVRAVAYYNVQNISAEDMAKASQVKFTLSLYQKDNNGEYQKVDIGKYLDDVVIYDKNNTKYYDVVTYTYCIKTDDLKFEAGSFEAETSFDVITGVDFEAAGLMYSNYKAVLSAELLDESGATIANSSCNDHIIYTNAKICTDMLSVG